MTSRLYTVGLRGILRAGTLAAAVLWPGLAAADCLPNSTNISSVGDLQMIANNLAGNYCLTQDIVANGQTISPFGDQHLWFSGVFDGQSHTIDSLKVSSGGIYVGLFGDVAPTGVIKNVGLTNLSVNAPFGYDVGGLVGRNHGTISNTLTTGSVTGTAGNKNGLNGIAVGGLVGWNFGTITQSYSAASVTSPGTGADLGGLSGGNDGTISNSYSTGSVSVIRGLNIDQFSLGGLVGRNNASGYITQSRATGIVNAQGSEAAGGGLVGVSHGGTILQSYAGGSVYGGSSGYAGGLVGYMDSGGSISASFATGAVDAPNSSFAGGLVGQMINSTLLQAYATGAVDAGNNGQAAGLVAWGLGSTISQSYAIGRVTGSSSLSGGLVGPSISPPKVTNSYWDVQTSGQSNSGGGGVPLRTTTFKADSLSVLGFKTIWGSNKYINDGYPYLLWEVSHGIDYRVRSGTATTGVPLGEIPGYNGFGTHTYTGGTQFVGTYLRCDASIGYLRQKPDASLFSKNGLTVVSIFELGSPTSVYYFKTRNAGSDVAAAIGAAHAAGQPSGSAIYFTVDYEPAKGDLTVINTYLLAIKNGLNGSGYKLGVYGSGTLLSYLVAPPANVSRVSPDYTRYTSNLPRGTFAAENIEQVYVDHPSPYVYLPGSKSPPIDLDTAKTPDFGQWKPPSGVASACVE
jgi:Domain of unknown function (DUF1906)